ncbi:cytochrome P450 CYP82J17-like [Andrographis paniculata]|uniref:cytochrome P450 CYP82J17-like n=1 Tax=Andrographis paniculata TaxID=175694 RepID=UPI0021E93B7C|nr:cytochrome P450 CYP82J17-like [Andrographis paniculata]
MINIFSDLLFVLPLLAFLFLFLLLLKTKPSFGGGGRRRKTPPEPAGGWPVIGHLHLLGGGLPPHRVLGAFADRYGPIFTVRLGVHPTVVVSSPESVKECFTKNDRALAKRPATTHGVYLGYDFSSFGFSHGPYWREVRKLVLQEMLCARRLEIMTRVRESEVHVSIAELYEAAMNQANSGKVVMTKWLEQLTLNMIMRMINGKRYAGAVHGGAGGGSGGGRPFQEIVREFMYVSGQSVPSDIIPFSPLKWIDFGGYIKSMRRISEEVGVVCEQWIDEHVAEGRKLDRIEESDFIDVMLAAVDDKFTRFGFDHKTIIKATISGLILAGSDTTSVHMTWIVSLLLNNDQVMQRARAEISEKVGNERWVQESDIKNLVYLHAIVKEALRLYPPGPLAVPHEAIEDCNISGYDIPKGTRVMVNLWKLHRDPSMWTDPDRFVPERFLMENPGVDFSGHHHEFIPFGSGRRACPGASFAMQVTYLTIARLLQGFDITIVSGNGVDMKEGMGITLVKESPLEVAVTPRLPSLMYQN